MSDNWRPTWLTDNGWRIVLLALFVLIMALGSAGCAGTKAANTAMTYELGMQRDGIYNQNWDEVKKRWERMTDLQECRNETEGVDTTLPMNDEAVAIAKDRLKKQAALLRKAWAVADTFGGGFFGSYWKQILALATLIAGIGAEEYTRRKTKKKLGQVEEEKEQATEAAKDTTAAIQQGKENGWSAADTANQVAWLQMARGYPYKQGSVDAFRP